MVYCEGHSLSKLCFYFIFSCKVFATVLLLIAKLLAHEIALRSHVCHHPPAYPHSTGKISRI